MKFPTKSKGPLKGVTISLDLLPSGKIQHTEHEREMWGIFLWCDEKDPAGVLMALFATQEAAELNARSLDSRVAKVTATLVWEKP